MSNNEEITGDNLTLLKLKYLDIMRELDRLKKKKKIQYYIINIIYYIIFIVLSTIPFVGQLCMPEDDKYAIYTSVSSMIFLCFVHPVYIIITNKLNYINRKFIYNKTHLKLRNEGIKLLNWKRHKRYHIYIDINGVIDIFIKKVSSIIHDNVTKILPMVLNDDSGDYEARVQIANNFMSSEIISQSMI